jgi:hypothetical protein
MKNKQDGVLDGDKTMDNVQKHNICIQQVFSYKQSVKRKAKIMLEFK